MINNKDDIVSPDNRNHSEKKINIFVYGTLKPGEDNYNSFCHNKYTFMQEAHTKGDIYDLPLGFPAMVESGNIVKGVLFEFNDKKVLEEIDILEGYDPNLPDSNNLYYKKLVEVFDENKNTLAMAWTYFMTLERVMKLGGRRVESGSWTKRTSFKTDEHKELVSKIRSQN